MEPFKNLLNPALVKAASRRLRDAWSGFDPRRFERVALRDLEALEMKARAMRIADALEATLPIGNAAAFAARTSQHLVVDLVVHYVKANGSTSSKAFKGLTLDLDSGERRDLRKLLPMRDVSIRKHVAGKHRVVMQVNGRAVAERVFVLTVLRHSSASWMQ